MNKLEYFGRIMNDNPLKNQLKSIGLYEDFNETFWKWFYEKSILFTKENVAWNINDYPNVDYVKYGYCHMNSFRLCLENNFALYSGIVIQLFKNRFYENYQIHSFNYNNYKVIDYTYYINIEKFDQVCIKYDFPFEYMGVEIPRKFICKIRELFDVPKLIVDNNFFVPLIIAYFYYDSKVFNWVDYFDTYLNRTGDKLI